jgi:hypothetical protein
LEFKEQTPEDDEGVTIYRLKTSFWHDANGAYTRKELRIMKRMSGGGGHYPPFREDLDNCGAQQVIDRIINLHEMKDGLYTLVVTNESRDWESGFVDDWDYALVPHQPTPKKNETSKNRKSKRVHQESTAAVV